MKQILLKYLTTLLSEIKDPKSLLLRTATVVVFLLGYFVIENPDAFLKVTKEFTREAMVKSIEEERLAQAPIVAKERAALIYGQLGADLVYIATYDPKQQNDYLTIIAREGAAGPAAFDMRIRMVVKKTSKMYLDHLSSKTYIMNITDDEYNQADPLGYSDLLFNGLKLQESGIRYLFTCPIYSSDNIYSGHIGIGYKREPNNIAPGLFETICYPNARAVGRYL
jgi:hypothetical protein